MMTADGLIARLFSLVLATCISTTVFAQDVRVERLEFDGTGEFQVIEDAISGDEMVEYVVTARQRQIISVDLLASKPSAYFNVLPAGSSEAIFVGSIQGNVADSVVRSDGDYVIRTYLIRSAARRSETAVYTLGVSIGAPEFADGLAGGPDYWKVTGVGGGDALNLREGPSTRYPVAGKLRNGDALQNKGCRLTGEERWCSIRAAGSGLTGWVAGQFLVETAAPRAPASPDGGPVGNGGVFDATGYVACATVVGQPLKKCPFGVIRAGAGNAGVWIAMGNGAERHILFENGSPVAGGLAAGISVERKGDLYVIQSGSERFEIPEAVVFGG